MVRIVSAFLLEDLAGPFLVLSSRTSGHPDVILRGPFARQSFGPSEIHLASKPLAWILGIKPAGHEFDLHLRYMDGPIEMARALYTTTRDVFQFLDSLPSLPA